MNWIIEINENFVFNINLDVCEAYSEANFGGGNETIKFSMIRFLGIFIERF